jgi:hypothetical protein
LREGLALGKVNLAHHHRVPLDSMERHLLMGNTGRHLYRLKDNMPHHLRLVKDNTGHHPHLAKRHMALHLHPVKDSTGLPARIVQCRVRGHPQDPDRRRDSIALDKHLPLAAGMALLLDNRHRDRVVLVD